MAAVCAVLCCPGGKGWSCKQGMNHVACSALQLERKRGLLGRRCRSVRPVSALQLHPAICNDKRVSSFFGRREWWRAGQGPQRLRWMDGMDGWMDGCMAGQQTWSSTVHMHTPAVWSKYSLVPFPASSAAGHCRLQLERERREKNNSSGFCPVPAASLSRQTFVPRHRQPVYRSPKGDHFFLFRASS